MSIDLNSISKLTSLNNDEIHILIIEFSKFTNQFNQYYKLLSKKEKQRADKFHFEKDRHVFAITRAILRLMFSQLLKIKPSEIKLKKNDYGKPYLDGSHNSNIFFNVSHSKNYAIIGINLDSEIGVDIEFVNEKFITDEIAKNYFSKYEIDKYFSLSEHKKVKSFFNLWTRKEAYIKAKGMGLSIPLNSFDISLDETSPIIIKIGNKINISDWHINNLSINNDYCASLIYSGQPKKIIQSVI